MKIGALHVPFFFFLQVFAESQCRNMKRQRITCWFVQTALSPLLYAQADRWNTAPESARSRKTSTAGEYFLIRPRNLGGGLMLLSLCNRSIYIFFLFIICSSLNYFPHVSAGLSTFSGTTGNATCFLLTVSPTGCRGRPMSTTLCMKKKVSVIMSVKHLRLSVIMFCLDLMPSFREIFTGEQLVMDSCVGSPVFSVFLLTY